MSDRPSPRAPRGLGVEGRAVWRECWRLPRIEDADRLAVENLARLADEAAALRAVINEQGAMLKRRVQNSRGDIVDEEFYSHPATASLRAIGKEIGVLSSELGLTPKSRAALGLSLIEAPREGNKLDELRKRRENRLVEMRAKNGLVS